MSDMVWQALIAGVVTIVLAWMKHDTDKKLQGIHTLVNSRMGVQMRISAAALRSLSALSKKQGDAENADAAERLLGEHNVQQAIADAEEK